MSVSKAAQKVGYAAVFTAAMFADKEIDLKNGDLFIAGANAQTCTAEEQEITGNSCNPIDIDVGAPTVNVGPNTQTVGDTTQTVGPTTQTVGPNTQTVGPTTQTQTGTQNQTGTQTLTDGDQSLELEQTITGPSYSNVSNFRAGAATNVAAYTAEAPRFPCGNAFGLGLSAGDVFNDYGGGGVSWQRPLVLKFNDNNTIENYMNETDDQLKKDMVDGRSQVGLNCYLAGIIEKQMLTGMTTGANMIVREAEFNCNRNVSVSLPAMYRRVDGETAPVPMPLAPLELLNGGSGEDPCGKSIEDVGLYGKALIRNSVPGLADEMQKIREEEAKAAADAAAAQGLNSEQAVPGTDGPAF